MEEKSGQNLKRGNGLTLFSLFLLSNLNNLLNYPEPLILDLVFLFCYILKAWCLMNFIKSCGIVLKNIDLSEQDRIVTFYTKDYGIIEAVAKGARKIKSRFSVAVQFPSLVDILIYRKKPERLGIITDCKIRYLFPEIRSDILRFAYASYISEVALLSLRGEEKNKKLFYLLVKTFLSIEREKKSKFYSSICSFKLKLLHILGYRPQLKRCVECGKDVHKLDSLYFAPARGGILCQSCQRKEQNVIGISRIAAMEISRFLEDKTGNLDIKRIKPVIRQINDLLDIYFSIHIDERRINSQILIKDLENLEKNERRDIDRIRPRADTGGRGGKNILSK